MREGVMDEAEHYQAGKPELFVPFEGYIDKVLDVSLWEDMGAGSDITTCALVSPQQRMKVDARAREEMVLCGMPFVRRCVQRYADSLTLMEYSHDDGELLPAGAVIFSISGSARKILTIERALLNLLSHLSGIATATRAMVSAAGGNQCSITHTRKTLAGLRPAQGYAVVCGGGSPHRSALGDAVLIKDNHLAAWMQANAANPDAIAAAVTRARAQCGHMRTVAVEVDDMTQFEQALAAQADVILLDNFTPQQVRAAVSLNRQLGARRVVLEASGGIRLENVAEYAATGVDIISVGALTQSARAVDIGFDAALDAPFDAPAQ